nr:hypothetical protein Iba_chr04fCG10520 [Ipomoea batatas]
MQCFLVLCFIRPHTSSPTNFLCFRLGMRRAKQRRHQPSPATEQRSSIIGRPLFFAAAMAATSAKPIASAFDSSGKSWQRWPSREPPSCDFYSSGSSCNVAPSLLRPGMGNGSGKKQRREQASFSRVLVVAVEALLVDDGNGVSGWNFDGGLGFP